MNKSENIPKLKGKRWVFETTEKWGRDPRTEIVHLSIKTWSTLLYYLTDVKAQSAQLRTSLYQWCNLKSVMNYCLIH